VINCVQILLSNSTCAATPSYAYDYNNRLDTAATLNVYLLIIYTGFNSLTNMGHGLLDYTRRTPRAYPRHTLEYPLNTL